MVRVRLIREEDAETLAASLRANRLFLAPFEPRRKAEFFTVEGQRKAIRAALTAHAEGLRVPHVIVADDESLLGQVTLSGIERGAFQSCHLGYWVSEHAGGRGVATVAVGRMLRVAFDELGLHRVQAATLVDNLRSQRVLRRHEFTPIGTAPAYLKIAGRWQDCVLFQRLSGRP